MALLIQPLVLAVVALEVWHSTLIKAQDFSIDVCETVSSSSDKQRGKEWCSDSPSMASPPHITVDEIVCPEISGPMNNC